MNIIKTKSKTRLSLYSPIYKKHKAKIKCALLAQVNYRSSSGPKSSWAEETTTPLRGVNGLFTALVVVPWALKCLKVRSLGRAFSSVPDSHTGLR